MLKEPLVKLMENGDTFTRPVESFGIAPVSLNPNSSEFASCRAIKIKKK